DVALLALPQPMRPHVEFGEPVYGRRRRRGNTERHAAHRPSSRSFIRRSQLEMTEARIANTTLAGKRAAGFTLLELMTTLIVISVLLTVAVPGFFDTIRTNRAAANANELVTALSIARSEAI